MHCLALISIGCLLQQLQPAVSDSADCWEGAASGLMLNLGCGRNRREGWVNVDSDPDSGADVVLDLERTPWPFPTSSASHVELAHVLEHLGADYGVFGRVLQEIYRVAAPDALVFISVPHHTHPTFAADPTHVRPITALLFPMLSRRQCLDWIRIGASNTPLALQLGVNFDHQSTRYTYDEAHSRFLVERGLVTEAELEDMALTERLSALFPGLISQIDVTLVARKDGEAAAAEEELAGAGGARSHKSFEGKGNAAGGVHALPPG